MFFLFLLPQINCDFDLQDQFAVALSQAVGSVGGKKEDELVGSKLNKVQ